MKKKISVKAIEDAVGAPQFEFPKYTTQVINLVNGNAGGTRPKIVGQMSELIQEFPGQTIQEWITWYNDQQPDAVDKATDRIYEMYQAMQQAFTQIDKTLIRKWVEDLVYTKTFCGLKFQEAILKYVADELNVDYRLATVEEEAQNVDGFINGKPVQIKSSTYTLKNTGEVIEVPIVFYEKKKDGIVIEYDPNCFK
ncbi:MAG: MjaI family restriction endonuclease [Bacteroidales bacterium]|nr:MjaI family restriction endonuclease [Bacteroidales bacterium]